LTSTANVNTTGIITASSFGGSGSSLTGLTGAAAGTYGNSTVVPQIVVNANGRITSISNVSISGGSGGSNITIQNNGSLVGSAGTINFAGGLSVSPLSAGIVTVTSSYSNTSGIATVAGYATTAGIATVAGYATTAGTVGYANTAGISTNVSITNESSDSETFITFANSATGNQQLKTNSGLKFNSTNGLFSATSLSGQFQYSVSVGSGLTSTGAFNNTSNIVLSLATPSSITSTSSNSVTSLSTYT